MRPIVSGGRRAPADGRGVYEQFAAAARRHAAGIAVVHGDAAVTYAGLLDRVDELRLRFVSSEVPQDSAVVVQGGRGIGYVVAVLATLAHGCHFVPVAETEPEARVAQIVQRVDAAARVVLSASGEPAVTGVERFAGTRRAGLAYIMHTSGSTGAPKGAAVPMAALTNLLDWYGEQLSVTPDARIAQLSRPSFDFSIPEIFLPLVRGARMVVPLRPIAGGLIPVTEYLIEQEVTVLQLVPTLLRPFVSLLEAVAPMADRLRSLSTIVCNGESLPDGLRRDVARVLPATVLVNSYGPTETCVAVTWHRCSQQPDPLPNLIGTAMPNVDLYVLSDELEPVPAGQVGELWIGGVQVGRGYVGDDAETRHRFLVPDAEGATPGAERLYRTGDMVRVLADGGLEYIGRGDRQVQLRGVRVELGEIEAAIREAGRCEQVRVVAVPGSGEGTADALECFVTPGTVDVAELGRRVRSRLPEDRWIRRLRALPALPASANGKTDDAALLVLARRSADSPGPDGPGDPESGNGAPHATGSPVSSLYRVPSARGAAVGASPRTSAEQVLREVLAGVIGRVPAADEPLHDLGLDSLGRLEVQVAAAGRGFLLSPEVALAGGVTLSEAAAGMSRTARSPGPGPAAGPAAVGPAALREEFGRLFDEACDGVDLLVVQSSLPDFTGVSVHDVLSILLAEIARVSRRVTVALPAYTLSFITSGQVDLTNAPSESGVAATHVARALGGRRTRHPVYSFVVVGPEAPAVADVDWAERSTFGDDSVFGWISEMNANSLMLATDAYAQVHRSEYLAGVPYHSYTYAEGRVTDHLGTRDTGALVYARDIPDGDAQCLAVNTDAIFELGREAVNVSDLAVCRAAVIGTRAYATVAVPALQEEPYALIKPENLDRVRTLVEAREAGIRR
ncbi:AMP-binding protein [Catenulispora sp. NL8]|uniref:AMP-binding protein n=1 Tax=Catenulispora pinistramenti TaxID=2705254 RepID=A0ABS5KXY5_9ACTN|nr:AMP-binding protein [Catenulispora pinistramenti]MBS2550870.1 AMP-binding protein [Catenulispora pinistramenti]